MARVFLAYKRVDIARAQEVRAKLEALDVPLFMDVKMDGSQNYISVINQQLAEASAVLVLWTQSSIVLPSADETNFVISEAERGYTRKILVAASFDRIVQPPVPFNTIHAPDLSDWIETGAQQSHPQWQKVLEALGRRLGRPGLPQLARTLDIGTPEARHAFVRQYPDDPSAGRIADALAATERDLFDEQVQTAEQRINRRLADNKRKLKGFREEFDARIALLRQGKEFQRIDVLRAFETKADTLQDELLGNEKARQALDARIAESERAKTAATDRAAALDRDISDLNAARRASADELAALGLKLKKAQEEARSKESVFTQMMRERVELESAIAELREAETVQRGAALELTRQRDSALASLEDRKRALAALEQERAAAAKRYRRNGAVAAAVALLIGGIVGQSIFSRDADGTLFADNARLERQVRTISADLDQKTREASGLRARIAATPPAAQGGELVPVQNQIKELEAKLDRKDNDLKTANARIAQLIEEGNKIKDQPAPPRSNLLPFQLSSAPPAPDSSQVKKQGEPTKLVAATAPKPRFVVHANYDMIGGDYQTQRDVTRERCSAECEGNNKCVAYTYDKWKQHCSLKETVNLITLEPKGETGVRSDQPAPKKVEEQERFCAYNGKAFADASLMAQPGNSKDSCRQLCRQDQSCIAFTLAGDGMCRTFASTTQPALDSRSSSEVKAQKPASRWCR